MVIIVVMIMMVVIMIIMLVVIMIMMMVTIMMTYSLGLVWSSFSVICIRIVGDENLEQSWLLCDSRLISWFNRENLVGHSC